MSRFAKYLLTGLFGWLVVTCVLTVLWMLAPNGWRMEDEVGMLTAAMREPLDSIAQRERIVYIGSSNATESYLIDALIHNYPGIEFRNWGQMPRDAKCFVAPCGPDNRIYVETTSKIFWNTAQARVATFNASYDAILVNAFGGWKIVLTRGEVI